MENVYEQIERRYKMWLQKNEPHKKRMDIFGRCLAYAQKNKVTIREAADALGERLRINEMCITCSNHIAGSCEGTLNPVYTGCVWKNKEFPDDKVHGSEL